jgi:hypothetical protein
MGNEWTSPASWDVVCRRSAGRRRYHAVRRLRRDLRRERVAELLLRYGLGRGVQARIARELGVHRSVITKDVQALLDTYAACPCCGSFVPRDQIGTGPG